MPKTAFSSGSGCPEKPTTIIGVSTIGGDFSREVVEAMSRINERPIILALSNPNSCAKCTPEQAYT